MLPLLGFSPLFSAAPADAAPSLPGWVEAGPERGHVMDVATRGDEVLALTRTGVLKSDRSLDRWSRAPEFPTNTRHLATARDGGGAWSDTPKRIWRVGSRARAVAWVPSGGVIVDLVGVTGGAVFALRGDTHGLWRVDDEGNLSEVLADVDPWVLSTRGDRVYAGTLDQGLWVSEDGGASFTQSVAEGAVSALGTVGQQTWVAFSDGRVVREGDDRPVCLSKDGPPLALAQVDGRTLLVLDSADGPLPNLYACGADGVASPVAGVAADDALPAVEPSGIWPLDAGHALLGTFRTGPILVSRAGAAYARTGFRATLTSAVAAAAGGEIVLALMSTGVFHSTDGGRSWTPIATGAADGNKPVTDAMDVAIAGQRILVADFNGISIGRDDRWYRSGGAFVEGGGRPNALVEVADDGRGGLWGRDFAGGTWRQATGGWTACAQGGVTRLDGEGESLVFATAAGFLHPGDCDEPAVATWPAIAGDTSQVHSDGHWAAGGGALWLDGERVLDYAFGAVQALAARGVGGHQEVLVATGSGGLLRCDRSACAPATHKLPGPVVAVGWTADGTIWAAEQQGTFLLAEGETDVSRPSDASALAPEMAGQRPGADVAGPAAATLLSIPPWRGAGRAGFGPSGPAPGDEMPRRGASTLPLVHTSPVAGEAPTAAATGEGWSWIHAMFAAEAVAAAGLAAAAWRLRRKGSRRRRTRR